MIFLEALTTAADCLQRRWLPALWLATACTLGIAAECESPDRLRFSLVPQGNVQRDIAALQPLFADLQEKLGIPIEAVMPTSYGSVVEALLAGAVDLARLGPSAYVSAKKQDAALTPFATYTRAADALHGEGIAYYSMLIVRSDSRLANVPALRGKKLVLVDPGSASGALIPRHVFAREAGVAFDTYFARIVYSGDHDESVRAVARRHADAAFVSSMHLAHLISAGKFMKKDFRILWRSAPIPMDPFVLRGQLCAPIKQKIMAAFLDHDGQRNRALLDKLKAVRFVPVADSDYRVLRELP